MESNDEIEKELRTSGEYNMAHSNSIYNRIIAIILTNIFSMAWIF